MIDRDQIETLLRIQGVSPTSPDEVIRSILLSARFNDDEIETAITVLRENKVDSSSRVEGLHKIFRSEKGLKPNEISQLLGIDVTVDEVQVRSHRNRRGGSGHLLTVIILTLVVTFAGVIFAMHYHKIGPFQTVVANY